MPHDLHAPAAIRYCIEQNQRDLAAIDTRRAAFRAEAAKLAGWARATLFVPATDIERFNGTVDDALCDLFHRAVEDIEGDLDADRALVGAA